MAVENNSSLMWLTLEGLGSVYHRDIAEVAVTHGEHAHEDDVGGVAVDQHLRAALVRSCVAVPVMGCIQQLCE